MQFKVFQTIYEGCDKIDHLTLEAVVKWKYTFKFFFNFIFKEIEMLDSSKAIQESDIQVKIIISMRYFCRTCNFFNETLEKSLLIAWNWQMLPQFSKRVHVPQKNNYRPVNILPILCKLFERLVSKQLSQFFEIISSKFRCGFRKDYGAELCLLMMVIRIQN